MGSPQPTAVVSEFIPEKVADEILAKYFTPDHPAPFTAEVLRRVLLDAIAVAQFQCARLAAFEARYWDGAGGLFANAGVGAASNICAQILGTRCQHENEPTIDVTELLARSVFATKQRCARLAADASRAKADKYSRENQLFMAAAAHATGADIEDAILKGQLDTGQQLTRAQLHEIFRKIAAGERHHGEFLTTFAQAFLRADDMNEFVLVPAAAALVRKYNLESYAQDDENGSSEAVQA